MRFYRKGIIINRNLIIADLHIGLEDYLNLDGNQIPIALNELTNEIVKITKESKAKRLIINGDLKHSFTPFEREFKEIRNFFEKIKPYFDEIIVVRGNHDTGIKWIEKLGAIVLDEYKIGKWKIVHGHKEIEGEKFIIGHEHPAIKLRDKVGAIVKVEAFLKHKNLIILPAFSPWASGNDILNEQLSPITRKFNLEDFEVYVPLDDEILYFGKVKDLYKVIW